MSSALEETRSQVSPVAQAVEAGGGADGGGADGVECVPDADGGHGFGFGGRAGFIEGLGDDGEGAVGADGKAEPVGLADLAETADPEAAGGHGSGLGLGADGVLIAADGGVGDGDADGLRAACGEVGKGDGLKSAGGGDLAGGVRADGVGRGYRAD